MEGSGIIDMLHMLLAGASPCFGEKLPSLQLLVLNLNLIPGPFFLKQEQLR